MVRYAILVLGAAVAAHANAQAPISTDTRTSAFDYDPASGLLTREIVEPDSSAFCVATVYTLDSFGNRTQTTTRNCNGTPINDGLGRSEAPAPTCATPGPVCDAMFASRSSVTTFAPNNGLNLIPGQFPNSSTNALQHSEQREFDVRFGTLTKVTGPNLLTTTWTYDEFGRKKKETRNAEIAASALTRTTEWFYEGCPISAPEAGTGTCPPLAVYRVKVKTLGAPISSTYYDRLNRAIRTETQGFDGSPVLKDTQFDALGRIAKVSRPFVTEGQQVWTSFEYDILGRVITVSEPSVGAATTVTRTGYQGLTTTVSVSNADSGTLMPESVVQVKTTRRNSQGQVEEITQ